MKEGESGSSSKEGKRAFPEDTETYKQIGSWELHISKKDKFLMIDTNDYHPGLLYISKEDLQEILKELSD